MNQEILYIKEDKNLSLEIKKQEKKDYVFILEKSSELNLKLSLSHHCECYIKIFCLNNGNFSSNIDAEINGQNSFLDVKALSFSNSESIKSFKTIVKHISAYSRSNQLFKILGGADSKSYFDGKIVVEKNAQKTEGFQKNNNILLSDQAKIVSDPKLEIYADDVKCSHGATCGDLSREQIYYMQTRGISENMAKKMLIQAFANEILESVQDDFLKQELSSKLIF